MSREPRPFQDHFSRVAEGYGRFRPTYPEALYRYLLGHVGSDARVWEVAAGSGQASRGLAEVFPRLLVTDGSWDQLSRAPADVSRAVCLADRAPLRDRSVDLVVVAQALHWLDQGAFFEEVSRVARPGGALAVWTYRLPEIGPTLDPLLRRFAHDEMGRWWPSDRRHVEDGYRSIAFPFRERPAPAFDTVATMGVERFLGYVGTWSAVGRARAAAGEDPLETFGPVWRDAWGAEAVRKVQWPITLRMFQVA